MAVALADEVEAFAHRCSRQYYRARLHRCFYPDYERQYSLISLDERRARRRPQNVGTGEPRRTVAAWEHSLGPPVSHPCGTA